MKITIVIGVPFSPFPHLFRAVKVMVKGGVVVIWEGKYHPNSRIHHFGG